MNFNDPMETRGIMDRFQKYVQELFSWNQEMKHFLTSEQVSENSELWGKLDQFSELIENVSNSLTNKELLDLQANAEDIHEELENYFKRKHDSGVIWIAEPEVPAGGHILPNLPYAYNALEPFISEEIMKLHHDIHHQSYVDGLNKAEVEMKKARETKNYSLVKHWSRELAFHGSGHYLHTIYWNNMSPNGGMSPKGRILKAMKHYFGNFTTFKDHFSTAANEVEGGGWSLLVWSPRSRHLEILQSEKHHQSTQWDTIPILVLDVWEHAYYLQYQKNRTKYIEQWWNLVNWDDVEMRFEKARELKWDPC